VVVVVVMVVNKRFYGQIRVLDFEQTPC